MTIEKKYDLNKKFNDFKKISQWKGRGVSEENISAKQSQKEEDPWIFGEDEYQKRSKGLEAEEIEGKEKADRLSERAIQILKERENQRFSGFQTGDEVREEGAV